MASIRENFLQVQNQIRVAAEHAEREAHSIQVIAVSKTKPVSVILEAIDAGITDIGENRVQEAKDKYEIGRASCRERV